MILDDVRDKAFDTLQMLKGRLEESDAYNQLRERFDTLAPPIQKAILVAVGLLIAYIIALFPMSYYDAGSENIALFEENRDLVLDLYRVKRHSASTAQIGSPLEPNELEGRARSAVTSARVQAEQIKAISPFENTGPGASNSGFIPKNVQQRGVEVKLANLNLSQVVEVGHSLSSISETTKMIGMEVRAGTQAGNYFDVTYKVVSFLIPTSGSGSNAKRK